MQDIGTLLMLINDWCIHTVFAHTLRCLSAVNFSKLFSYSLKNKERKKENKENNNNNE